MSKITGCLLFFLTFLASASENPCGIDNYPIINSRELTHPTSYLLPAIYYQKDNVTVIVPIKVAIDLVQEDIIALSQEGIESVNSVVVLAKNTILNSLKIINVNELVNSADLWVSPATVPEKSFPVALHVMIGYQAVFEKSLLRDLAVVKVDGISVKRSFFKYIHGVDSTTSDEYDQVHKVVVLTGNNLIYERCWIDK